MLYVAQLVPRWMTIYEIQLPVMEFQYVGHKQGR